MKRSFRSREFALAFGAIAIGAAVVLLQVARNQPWSVSMTEPSADAVSSAGDPGVDSTATPVPLDALPSTADSGANSTPAPDPFEDLTIEEFEASRLLPICMGGEVAIEELVIRRMKAHDFYDLSYSALNVPNEDVWVMAFVTRSPIAGRLDLPSRIDASGVPAGYPAPRATHANAATVRALKPGLTATSRFTDSGGRTTAYCVFWVDSDDLLETGPLHPSRQFWTIMDLKALPRQ